MEVKAIIEKMLTIVDSKEFSGDLILIGDPKEADAALEDLIVRIALWPQSFPVGTLPNERMATLSNNGKLIDVFFRIILTTNQIELLRLSVKNQ